MGNLTPSPTEFSTQKGREKGSIPFERPFFYEVNKEMMGKKPITFAVNARRLLLIGSFTPGQFFKPNLRHSLQPFP